MDGVYGDRVHQNDGTHLMGEIADDAKRQARFITLIVLNQQYDLPRGRVDTFLDDEFSDIIEGVMVHKWNFELLDGCFAAHQIGEQS